MPFAAPSFGAQIARAHAEIIRLTDEGKSNREVARIVGVDEGTVRNIGAEKRKASEIPQDASADFLTDHAKETLRRPSGRRTRVRATARWRGKSGLPRALFAMWVRKKRRLPKLHKTVS